MSRGTIPALLVAALLVAGCGGADEGTSTQDTTGEPAAENTLADSVGALESAGFERVRAIDSYVLRDPELTAVGAVEAELDEATFTAAEFATPAEAEAAYAQFVPQPPSLPLLVEGTTLVYANKCCFDIGPTPKVPRADLEAFESAIGLAPGDTT